MVKAHANSYSTAVGYDWGGGAIDFRSPDWLPVLQAPGRVIFKSIAWPPTSPEAHSEVFAANLDGVLGRITIIGVWISLLCITLRLTVENTLSRQLSLIHRMLDVHTYIYI